MKGLYVVCVLWFNMFVCVLLFMFIGSRNNVVESNRIIYFYLSYKINDLKEIILV